MTRVAAIDCGTNSIRLLVADVDPQAGTLVDVDRRMEIVRLGAGVDETGRLSDAALARTFAACERFAALLADLGATRVRFVATSATRDASNREEFLEGVLARLGVAAEVASGDEEAALSFTGATRELPAAGLTGPYLVVDIGGGSTEIVLGTDKPEAACSIDVGCVRMSERILRSDPPTSQEISAATSAIDAMLATAAERVPLRAGRLIGLAGTVTTVAAAAMGLPRYDPSVIHLARLPAEAVRRTIHWLLTSDRARRAQLPFMHPGRVDVIGAGGLILDRVLQASAASELVVSEHDILDGIAWSLA